jgi:hypothetical protein
MREGLGFQNSRTKREREGSTAEHERIRRVLLEVEVTNTKGECEW